ncbi:MAG: toll/interleukin-1 receptor domain-containing protein [Prosthecobacter sp.]
MSQSYHVFVSYSRDDKSRVLPWVEELKKGGASVFFDTESLLGGGKWQDDIAEAIRTARLVMFFVSPSSVASEFVPKELALSVDMKKTILPVLLEETEIRGQVAFCIAGLHRVEAFDPDPAKVWQGIQASLEHAGVEWKTPSRRLIDVRREGRDLKLDDGVGNVRITREHKPAPRQAPLPQPVPEPEHGTATAPGGRWLRRWFVLMAAAGAVILFFWMDGLSWFDLKTGFGKKDGPLTPQVEQKPVPKPELVETLEEEAQGVARDYYQAANRNPDSQLVFLAEKVDYLGRPGWTKSQVQADLEAYAKRWTRQQIDVLGTPSAHIIEAGKVIECDVPLRCTSENAIVKNTTSFTGRLRLQLIGSALKIVSVSEVPGTQKSEPLQFDPEAQQKVVHEFITRAVRSGSSDSGMTPEDIAAMYVEKPDYFGRTATHDEIIKETRNLISLWEIRAYRMLEQPEVQSGLGTPDVEVKVGLDYHVSSPSRGGKINQGWVRSSYLVHFTADGTPLIQKHAEVERGK